MDGTADCLVDLAALDCAAIAGNKAMNLGCMARMGLPTPGGFALTDRVFQQHLQSARVLPDIDALHAALDAASLSQLEAWSVSIGNRIRETGLAEGLLQALQRELQGRWPRIKLAVVDDGQASGQPIASRQVRIKVEVTEAPPDPSHPAGSGARDVRLFRNGSLIKVWRGDVLKSQPNITLEETVSIVAGEN